MNENTIDTENTSKPLPDTLKLKRARKAAKRAKPAKKAGRTKKAAAKPKADQSNKKAEVITLMSRAKGHVARNHEGHRLAAAHGRVVTILGSKGGEKIESSKDAAGERTYKIGK